MRPALLLILALALNSTGATISNLFFFGDSLTDTGNVFTATSNLSLVTLGLIAVQPQSPPYFNGRFSNGPVWAETTAARLGQAGDAARAGMSLGLFGSLTGPGNNYAIGGARNAYGGALGSFDALVPTGVLAQVAYYLNTQIADPNALYFLEGGGNDLRDAAKLATLDSQVQAAANAAGAMAASLWSLYQGGARQFLLMNAPNLGFIPESISAGRVNQGATVSLYYNYFLGQWATALGQLPGIHLQTFDIFSLYNGLVSDTIQGGSAYGFRSLTPCISGAVSCTNSLFFDEIHPTARVHAIVGNRVADQVLGISSDFVSQDVVNPEPATGALVAGAVLLAIGARLRRKFAA